MTNYAGNRKLDLFPLLIEFSMFSSIWNNFLTIDLMVSDAGSALSNFPIIGEEKFELTFKTDYIGYNTITLKLRCVAIERLNIANSRQEILSLRLCSDESIRDAKIRLMRAYGPKPISDIVQEVFDGKSDTDDKRLKSEWSNRSIVTKTATEGNRDIIIPNYSPSNAMNFLCRQAKAADTADVSSLFFFFEDQKGFHFTTPYEMITKTKGIKDMYIFTDKDTGNGDNITGGGGFKISKPKDMIKINSFQIDSLFDYENAFANGMLSNKVITIDPQYSIVKEYVHSYYADFDKFPKTTGALGYKKVSDNFIYNNVDGTNHLRVIQSNLAHQGQYTINPMNIDDRIPAMVAQYQILKDIVLTVGIPGDSDRAPGDKIRIIVPEFGSTEDSKTKRHRLLSGEYLVTSVRHMYNADAGYTTTLQVIKTCYESEIAPDVNLGTGIKESGESVFDKDK